jgi:mRNA-degrading endonuclease YafQ of YafQ-DinJ toxin-antitoxin module
MIKTNSNSLEIIFLDPFSKQLSNAPDDIQEAFIYMLELYVADPFHPQLRNHELREKFVGLRSFDVTDDWRAIFKETHVGERRVIKLYLIGTHNDLYGSP